MTCNYLQVYGVCKERSDYLFDFYKKHSQDAVALAYQQKYVDNVCDCMNMNYYDKCNKDLSNTIGKLVVAIPCLSVTAIGIRSIVNNLKSKNLPREEKVTPVLKGGALALAGIVTTIALVNLF